jgi:catechol 2,3-dioxygenase-like lactoylglutathione lyase family enzyme
MWFDLSAPDVDKAREFYSALFGWAVAPAANAGRPGRHISHGSRPGRSAARAVQAAPQPGLTPLLSRPGHRTEEGTPVAYDEDLAGEVRAALPHDAGVTERQMFGGLAFMLGGHMFCGVVKDSLMVRLAPEAADRALDEPHVRPMDFTGRPMKGMVFVDPAGLHGDALRQWVDAAASYARSLPPKPATPDRRRR